MGLAITYTSSVKNITPSRLRGFFVGWPNKPSSRTHYTLLKNSDQVVLAIDQETNMVVGFITAISDGILSAYIPFLEVLPAYRDHGIGHALVEKMLGRLKGLYMIDLLCDKDLRPFYRQLGMTEASGMMVRNRKRQTGTRS